VFRLRGQTSLRGPAEGMFQQPTVGGQSCGVRVWVGAKGVACPMPREWVRDAAVRGGQSKRVVPGLVSLSGSAADGGERSLG
jgi:hypothetical protein